LYVGNFCITHFAIVLDVGNYPWGIVLPNQYITERLIGIQQMLMGTHPVGGPLLSAFKGSERERFIEVFLSQVFPPSFRFGQGDVTDTAGRRSGQLDVVVEYPLLPSLPVVASSRLYLAEGVAAAIEVKSNVASQWSEVVSTATKLAPLERHFDSSMSPTPERRIPLFAIGYSGWKETKAIRERLGDAPIDGILVIDAGVFVQAKMSVTGSWSLWGLVACLHESVNRLKSTSADPLAYAVNQAFSLGGSSSS
jgi:hypothetical protein